MCPDCNGLGTKLEVDPALIVEHPDLSLLDGASRWYGNVRKKKRLAHATTCRRWPSITASTWSCPGRTCRRSSAT